MCLLIFVFIAIILFEFYMISMIPSKHELHLLKLDKSINYEELNSRKKRLCVKRLRLREKHRDIIRELQVINKELGDKE